VSLAGDKPPSSESGVVNWVTTLADVALDGASAAHSHFSDDFLLKFSSILQGAASIPKLDLLLVSEFSTNHHSHAR